MATYIRDDSLDNLQQSMSLLAQLAQRRKAQDLETAIAINRMGKNKEAEELILSSQRGLLGNLFGDEAKEWTVTNPFKKQKQEIYNVNADQGGLLAALTDNWFWFIFSRPCICIPRSFINCSYLNPASLSLVFCLILSCASLLAEECSIELCFVSPIMLFI